MTYISNAIVTLAFAGLFSSSDVCPRSVANLLSTLNKSGLGCPESIVSALLPSSCRLKSGGGTVHTQFVVYQLSDVTELILIYGRDGSQDKLVLQRLSLTKTK